MSTNNAEENRTWIQGEELLLVEIGSKYSPESVDLVLASNSLRDQNILNAMVEKYNSRARTKNFETRSADQINRKWASLVLYFQDEYRRRDSDDEDDDEEEDEDDDDDDLDETNVLYRRLYSVLRYNPMVIPPFTYSSATRKFTQY